MRNRKRERERQEETEKGQIDREREIVRVRVREGKQQNIEIMHKNELERDSIALFDCETVIETDS